MQGGSTEVSAGDRHQDADLPQAIGPTVGEACNVVPGDAVIARTVGLRVRLPVRCPDCTVI